LPLQEIWTDKQGNSYTIPKTLWVGYNKCTPYHSQKTRCDQVRK